MNSKKEYKSTNIFILTSYSISEMVVADNREEALAIFKMKYPLAKDIQVSDTSFKPIMRDSQ